LVIDGIYSDFTTKPLLKQNRFSYNGDLKKRGDVIDETF